MYSVLAKVDVLILCGGLGSRLRQVIPANPKGLAPIGGKPFLDILVEDLMQQGFRRFIFCVGYLKEQIIDRYSGRYDAEFLFSQEDVPLGTGGAVKNALPLTHSNPFLVVNGDSLCPVEFKIFYHFHQAKAGVASFVLTKVDKRHDGGVVRLYETQQIRSFMEKSALLSPSGTYINAGIYLLQQECFELQCIAPPFSLEYDLFPKMIDKNPCFGFVVESKLIDIGTPERYKKANDECGR